MIKEKNLILIITKINSTLVLIPKPTIKMRLKKMFNTNF